MNKNELLLLASVSDQRWFCGLRCVDGLIRGFSPGLGHGATWETRAFRGFQARRRTASQGAVVPHSVGSKEPPPGAQSNTKTEKNELLSFASVSDQRWFCGLRCVDGLIRGFSPGLGHGATWETRGL